MFYFFFMGLEINEVFTLLIKVLLFKAQFNVQWDIRF